jgi:hypothetical protein
LLQLLSSTTIIVVYSSAIFAWFSGTAVAAASIASDHVAIIACLILVKASIPAPVMDADVLTGSTFCSRRTSNSRLLRRMLAAGAAQAEENARGAK